MNTCAASRGPVLEIPFRPVLSGRSVTEFHVSLPSFRAALHTCIYGVVERMLPATTATELVEAEASSLSFRRLVGGQWSGTYLKLGQGSLTTTQHSRAACSVCCVSWSIINQIKSSAFFPIQRQPKPPAASAIPFCTSVITSASCPNFTPAGLSKHIRTDCHDARHYRRDALVCLEKRHRCPPRPSFRRRSLQQSGQGNEEASRRCIARSE